MAAGDTLLEFDALANRPPASGFASLGMRGDWPMLLLADAATEIAQFAALVPQHYRGGDLAASCLATADVASGQAKLQLDLYRLAPGDDLAALPAASATVAATATAPSTAGEALAVDFAAASVAGLAAGDWLVARISRLGGDAADTLGGVFELAAVTITEQ
ncbi:MAG: hypothetical protein KDA44_05790 [Planctomycetales bacterium]|nr:hypothetical protein [Planctomycetales bacterium]